MMLLRARDNNIQSFAFIWLDKGNQNEFLEHPKIKWLDGGRPPSPVYHLIFHLHLIFHRQGRPPSNH